MGKFGSEPAQTQQTSTVKLPAWVEQASQENYNLAKDVAGRPLQQYEGQMVASPSGMTTQAYDTLKGWVSGGAGASGVTDIGTISPTNILDATNPYWTEAANLYRDSSGTLDINKYLNPYTSEVENRAINNANTALTQQLTGISDAARKAGAFGGSRQAIQQGVAQAEGVRGIGDLSAELRRQGFDTASALATNEMARKAAAAGGILSTGGAVQGSRVAQQKALIDQQQQQMARRQQDQDINLQNITALLGAGGKQEGQQQREIDAQIAKFKEARDYPIEQLNIRLAALGLSPYGKTESSVKTATSEDKGPDWATLGLGVLKSLPALAALSDREDKTDIQKLGKDPKSGLDMYAYRYKGDPKSYPKVVGPMAQDIEKKNPKLVKKVGGRRVVTLENLMESLS